MYRQNVITKLLLSALRCVFFCIVSRVCYPVVIMPLTTIFLTFQRVLRWLVGGVLSATVVASCASQPSQLDSNTVSGDAPTVTHQLDGTRDINQPVTVQGAADNQNNQNNQNNKEQERSQLAEIMINEFAATRNPQQVDIHQCIEAAIEVADAGFAERCYQLALHQSDINYVIDAAKAWVLVDPDSQNAHQQLGHAYIVARRYDEALDSLLEARQRNIDVDIITPALNSVFLYGDDLVALIDKYRGYQLQYPKDEGLLLGEIILQTRHSEHNYYIGNYQKALVSLEELVNLDNNQEVNGKKIYFERPYVFQARSLHQLGRVDEAVAVLEKAIDKHPDYIVLYIELIELYLERRDIAKAEQVAMTLLHHNPADDVYYEIGKTVSNSLLTTTSTMVQKHFVDKSVNTKLSVREREVALLRLSILSDLNKDVDNKRKYLESITAASTLIIAAVSELATMEAEEHGLEAGKLYFNRARKRWPHLGEELWRAQALWLAKTDRSQAIALLNQIISVQPSENLVYIRGLYYALDGNIVEMEEDFSQILENNPKHINALNAYGYTLIDMTNRLEEGVSMINRAFTLDSERPAIVDSLGWAYYRKGNLQQALVLIHWAYSRLQDAEIGAHYGEILWNLGYTEEARILLDRELRREPNNDILKDTINRLYSNSTE